MPTVASAENCPGANLTRCARRSVALGFAVLVAATGLWTAFAELTPAALSCLVAWAAGLLAAFQIARGEADLDRPRAAGRGTQGRAFAWGHAVYLSLAAVAVVTALAPLAVTQGQGARLKQPTSPAVVRPASA
jgi:hypothetical protein